MCLKNPAVATVPVGASPPRQRADGIQPQIKRPELSLLKVKKKKSILAQQPG